MRSLIIALSMLSQAAIADGFDVLQFMASHELRVFDLDKLPDRQFFDEHKHVVINANGLSISNQWQNTLQTTLRVGAIEYVGTNNGEWGGKLEVIIEGEHKELMTGNIVHLLQRNEKLYIIEGLAHLGMAGGSIWVIENSAQPTEPKLIVSLPDAPLLVYLDKTRLDFQRLVIVGSKSIMSVDPYRALTIVYWDAFWRINLNPTSIVRYKNNYFIGLPHGVAVVPAPWGESSRYCRELPNVAEKRCQKVQFYADHYFDKYVN